MPLDHMTLLVPAEHLDAVNSFLLKSLEHMGFVEMMRPVPNVVGMGETAPYFWIAGVEFKDVSVAARKLLLENQHVAFTGKDVKAVKQFYNAALKAGGVDNGAPGRRPEYYAGYYGAFVRDPACGINFEVVYHGCPENLDELTRMEQEADAELGK